MNKRHLYILAGCLTTIGLALFVYKIVVLDLPLIPGARSSMWTVEAHFTFNATGKPIKAVLQVPRTSDRYTIVNENFIAHGYGVAVSAEKERRKATWAIRKAKGKQSLYYKASVVRVDRDLSAIKPLEDMAIEPKFDGASLEAARAILTEIRETSADTESFIVGLFRRLNMSPADNNVALLVGKHATVQKKIETVVQLLTMEGIQIRAVHGMRLEDQRRNADIIHWIEAYEKGRWIPYDLASETIGIPENYLAWWHGEEPLIQALGAKDARITLSVVRSEEAALQMAVEKGVTKEPFLLDFSLLRLPAQTQAVYRVVLLVPFGVLFLVILRNVVGLRTFGTFMPVLIALAFRETQLLWGIFLFTFLAGAGLLIRLYLEHLKLLVVPRLAAILIVVIGMMAFLSVLSNQLGLQRGLSVALFPMVVLSMTIERMSIVWDELGAFETIKQALGSMLAAIICYLIMSVAYIEHLAFVFPETLMILLAATLLLGRYSGMRLMELHRFKVLTEIDKDV